jgi:uncharacterized membrane protein YidH (DUF202 family)
VDPSGLAPPAPDLPPTSPADSEGRQPAANWLWQGFLSGDWCRWYYRSFLKGVCFHLPLVLLLVLIGLLLAGEIGAKFGVKAIIWHENWWKQFWIGIAFAVVAHQTLFASYMLWDRARAEGRLGKPCPEPLTFRLFFCRVALCLVGTCVGVLVFWALIERWRSPLQTEVPMQDPDEFPPPRCLLLGLLLGFAAPLGLSLLTLGRKLAAWEWPATIIRQLGLAERNLQATDTLSRWRWVFVFAGFCFWCVGVGLGYSEHQRLWVFAAVGMVLFLITALLDRRRVQLQSEKSPTPTAVGRWWDHVAANWEPGWLFINLVTHFALAYIWVTYYRRTESTGITLLALFGAALFMLFLGLSLPGPTRRWLRERFQAGEAVLVANDPRRVWPFVVLGGMTFFLFCNYFEGSVSPATVVCFFLFGLVVAYGFATAILRRTGAPALLVLLFFALLGGIQRYKFQYDGFPVVDVGVGNDMKHFPAYDRPLLLREEIKDDIGRQKEFDVELEKYAASAAKFVRASNQKTEDRPAEIKEFKEFGEAKQRLDKAWMKLGENKILAPRKAYPHLNVDLPSHHLLTTKDWETETENNWDPEEPLVVIAVSGGGLRSAAWTFQVLAALEEQFLDKGIDFPKRVRIITGASGGMLGAAYYVATLDPARDVKNQVYQVERKKHLKQLYENLTRDSLTPLILQR